MVPCAKPHASPGPALVCTSDERRAHRDQVPQHRGGVVLPVLVLGTLGTRVGAVVLGVTLADSCDDARR